MAFGSEVGAFAQGLLGGMNAVSQIRARNTQAAWYGAQIQKEGQRQAAIEEGRSNAEKRTGGGGGKVAEQPTVPAPRVTTEAIPGGVPVEQRLRGYAEGGVVRRGAIEEEALPPPAPAPAAPAEAPKQAITPNPGEVTPESNPAPEGEKPPPAEGGEAQHDPVRGAIGYMKKTFGLDQQPAAQQPQGAIPEPGAAPAQPANTQGIVALLKGEGAESNEVVEQARQRIDPEGQMPLSRRNAILLEEMSAAFYKRGLIEEGDRAAASLLQNFRRNMSMYGAFAVQAAEAGNFEQAAQLLDRAYAYIPDGNDMQVQPVEGGVQLTQVGPDGKPRGQPTVLRGAEAVRNVVGYAMDFDNWAKHLLSERSLNENVRLREMQLEETGRHNRATEGLQAASLAERRAERGRAERLEGEANASFQAVRAAQVEVRRAERALENLGEDATPEQRQAARQKVEEARARAEDMEARLPARAAGALSQIEARDAAADDRRRNLDSQIASREAQMDLTRLKTRLQQERDPAERRKLEAQIGALERRGTGSRAGGDRALTFTDRGKIEDAFAELNIEGMTPEAQAEAMPVAQGLATLNPGMGPREAAQAAVAIRQGKFKAAGTAEEPAVVVNGRAYAIPPGMTALVSTYYRQGNPPPVERRERPARPVPTVNQDRITMPGMGQGRGSGVDAQGIEEFLRRTAPGPAR